jgi:hypothetical protein
MEREVLCHCHCSCSHIANWLTEYRFTFGFIVHVSVIVIDIINIVLNSVSDQISGPSE